MGVYGFQVELVLFAGAQIDKKFRPVSVSRIITFHRESPWSFLEQGEFATKGARMKRAPLAFDPQGIGTPAGVASMEEKSHCPLTF
jgi:hypothetical protein